MKWGRFGYFFGIAAVSVTSVQSVWAHPLDWRTDEFAFLSALPVPPAEYPLPLSIPAASPHEGHSSLSFSNFEMDPDYLKMKLSEFSGEIPAEVDGKTIRIRERQSNSGRKLARSYLAQEYQNLGFQIKNHSYDGGENFVAEKPGRDPSRVLIVSAHLDSVGNAGADDDGSGTISALAVSRALARLDFKYTLRVVGFDQEELGLVGSQEYVSSLSKTHELASVLGNVNLEMTAYHGKKDGGFHVMDCDRADSVPLSEKVMGAIQELQIPLKRVRACTQRSDHASFWRAEKAAIIVSQNFFGGGANPCYHRRCDQVKDLDFTYMAHITSAVASAVAALLEMQ